MPEQHIDNEKIPTRLIGAIVAVGSLAFIGILTETVMTVLFPALMREFHVDTATVQWITTIYLLAVAATMPISSFLKRRFALKTIFLAAVILAIVPPLVLGGGWSDWIQRACIFLVIAGTVLRSFFL